MQKRALVIKIGGAILEQASALQALLVVLASIKQQPMVLVHGGGCVVDQQLAQAGFSSQKKHGLRVTPAEQMPLISGALAGFVNKTIVAKANAMAIPAVGLSLLDGNMASCQLNPQGLGAVGIPAANSSQLLDSLISAGIMPVISSIGALAGGELVNVNADDAAVVVCQLLNAELLLLTDVNGVKGQDGEYLAMLDTKNAEQLIAQGVISGGMTAKVQAALLAAQRLRRSIAVASWQQPQQIMHLLAGEAAGTRIQP